MNSFTPAVSIDGVVKTFGTVKAVDGLSLEIHPGEVVAFLGPNGAGKTTTVDIILGLSQPTSGTVEVFGGDPRRAIALGRVAAVMQTGGPQGLHGPRDRRAHLIAVQALAARR